MLKLKLQYFGPLMQRADSFEKTPILGKLRAGGEGDNRGWDGWMASLTQWTWTWVGSKSWWWTERPGMLQFMGSQRVGHDWATELNWTEGFLIQSTMLCILYVIFNSHKTHWDRCHYVILKMKTLMLGDYLKIPNVQLISREVGIWIKVCLNLPNC